MTPEDVLNIPLSEMSEYINQLEEKSETLERIRELLFKTEHNFLNPIKFEWEKPYIPDGEKPIKILREL